MLLVRITHMFYGTNKLPLLYVDVFKFALIFFKSPPIVFILNMKSVESKIKIDESPCLLLYIYQIYVLNASVIQLPQFLKI